MEYLFDIDVPSAYTAKTFIPEGIFSSMDTNIGELALMMGGVDTVVVAVPFLKVLLLFFLQSSTFAQFVTKNTSYKTRPACETSGSSGLSVL